MAGITLYRLNLYDSLAILPVQILAPGKTLIAVAPFANSLLSTVWVKSLDPGASVLVNWLDYGMEAFDPSLFPGERIDLTNHKLITTSDYSDRIIVTKIHNKALAEIVVTGGNAEVGIFVTCVSSFPMEAPYKDATLFSPTIHTANANVILDTTDGKLYFARGPAGAQDVNITGGTVVEEAFNVKIIPDQRQTTPNIEQDLINLDVPAGKNWRIRNIKIISRAYGKFALYADSVIIGEGVTSPAESNAKYEIFPYFPLAENLNVTVKFIQNFGASMDVSAYLQLTESDI